MLRRPARELGDVTCACKAHYEMLTLILLLYTLPTFSTMQMTLIHLKLKNQVCIILIVYVVLERRLFILVDSIHVYYEYVNSY